MLTVVFTLSISITIINTIHGMNISLPGSQLNQFQIPWKIYYFDISNININIKL